VPNRPVLFYSLASVGVCRLLSFVTAGRRAGRSVVLSYDIVLLFLGGKVGAHGSYFYPHKPIGNVWIYRLLFVCLCVCTVTDFSAKDKVSGVIFCSAVHRHARQGISHFGKLCSPISPKLDKSDSARATPTRMQRITVAPT